MIDDLDIWRAANLLIKRYGPDAAVMAAQRADELLAVGDADGLRHLEANS
jgi:triphosphoribosyl-dephospho-CoA synthetase